MVGMVRAPLFVPADRPERFAKAAASDADAVILDLEDAVAAGAKDQARAHLSEDFTGLPASPRLPVPVRIWVRINAYGTPWHAADVAAVARLAPAAVVLPKAEDAATCSAVAEATGIPVIALIESARGLAHARAIAAAKGVRRLAFGSIDFCADLGCAHLREALLPARVELVLASRLAGIAAPLDGVTVQLDDPAPSHEDAAYARALGMTGKLCIHPKQIAQVLRAFAPSAEDIDWARRVIISGEGAVSVDGAMVDEPVRIRARAILAEARE